MALEFDERRSLKLWRTPFKTVLYFLRECFHHLKFIFRSILKYKFLTCFSILTFLLIGYMRVVDSMFQEVIAYAERKILWYSWWILLGFLSSCGFGSGLHTFVLYLGPFIAQVTISAYICQSLDFPEPPYPDSIVCPKESDHYGEIYFFNIVRKVQLESVLWGFGTAIGELPPYFMARGARLAGKLSADEIEVSLSNDSSTSEPEIDKKIPEKSTEKISFYQRLEVFLQCLVTRAGFVGILLCASVPNPLFDLAGMTCGHFLIPFSTFFAATCIGKALIKAHIQQFAVIAASSENHIDSLVEYIGKIPVIGSKLRRPFMEYLQQQKDKLQNKAIKPGGWIQFTITLVVTAAMAMFVISIINAMAQTNHRRMCHQQRPQIMAKKKSNSPTKTAAKRKFK